VHLLFSPAVPDPCQFSADLFAFPMGNGVHDITQFMDDTALARRRGKESRNGGKQALMPISDDQIHLRCSTTHEIRSETVASKYKEKRGPFKDENDRERQINVERSEARRDQRKANKQEQCYAAVTKPDCTY
jgi:hypothetical protein